MRRVVILAGGEGRRHGPGDASQRAGCQKNRAGAPRQMRATTDEQTQSVVIGIRGAHYGAADASGIAAIARRQTYLGQGK